MVIRIFLLLFTTCVRRGFNTIIGIEWTNLYLFTVKRLEDGNGMAVFSLGVVLCSILAT